jgi:uncharacterized protein (TIGR03435 family)
MHLTTAAQNGHRRSTPPIVRRSSVRWPVMMRWLLPMMAAATVFSLSQIAYGQSNATQAGTPTPDAPPAFDLAAIRPNKTDTTGHSHILSNSSNGLFNTINVSLKFLMEWSYVLPEARIVGGPAWFDSTKFDIEAKADEAVDKQLGSLPSATARAQKQAMVRALLADRFQLKVHEETRELPIYALVLTKDGPKFQPSKVNGTTIDSRRAEIRVLGSDDTLALLVDELGKRLGRPVINQTGIHGRYELDLKWAAEDAASPQPAANAASPTEPSGPSIFTAIQEQFGLKLVPQKGPVSVFVVDRAEMPSEN